MYAFSSPETNTNKESVFGIKTLTSVLFLIANGKDEIHILY